VSGGGATEALDRGWEAAEAIDDGEPRQRREYSSGGRKER
jgi:hypothetical protein